MTREERKEYYKKRCERESLHVFKVDDNNELYFICIHCGRYKLRDDIFKDII